MDIDAYLHRLTYTGSRQPTIATLQELHRSHLRTVPFENLDIPLGRSITLSLPNLYDKVVNQRRGGFCYELNGLFAWLLEQLGFRVRQLSGRVFNGPHIGPDFDHLVLAVQLPDGREYLADVGFGDSFLDPLPLNTSADPSATVPQSTTDPVRYQLVASGGDRLLQRQRSGLEWDSLYQFSLISHPLAAFTSMCHYQQTSPDSHFTQKSICSIATPQGRVTLSNNRLILTTDGQREQHRIVSEADYRSQLHRHFGIILAADAPIHKLMQSKLAI